MESEDFERQVERVFSVIEANGTNIIWNKKHKEPDTGNLRQIDIEIRRPNGEIVHAECRNRKSKQDVMWIEELIGRRISLGVNSVMAVSAAGFSKAAYIKANKHSVITWQLSKISKDELYTLFHPPEISFPVFRNIFLSIGYYTSTKYYFDVMAELSKDFGPQLSDILALVSKYFLDDLDYETFKSLPSQNHNIRDELISLRSGSTRRVIRAQCDFAWERSKPDLHKGFRKGPPINKAFVANVFLKDFSSISLEMIFGNEKWDIMLDQSKVIFPENSIIGNSFQIGHDQMGGKRMGFRCKIPDVYNISVSATYRVFLEL